MVCSLYGIKKRRERGREREKRRGEEDGGIGKKKNVRKGSDGRGKGKGKEKGGGLTFTDATVSRKGGSGLPKIKSSNFIFLRLAF